MPIGGRPTGAASGPDTPPRLTTGEGPTVPLLIPIDYQLIELESSPADADGTMYVATPPLPSDIGGLVERLAIQVSGTSGATFAQIAAGINEPDERRDFTTEGTGNVAEYPRPMWLPPSWSLWVRWTGADPGAIGVAHVQIRRVMMTETSTSRAPGV